MTLFLGLTCGDSTSGAAGAVAVQPLLTEAVRPRWFTSGARCSAVYLTCGVVWATTGGTALLTGGTTARMACHITQSSPLPLRRVPYCWVRPTEEAVNMRLPAAVGPEVPPGRTQTAPVELFSSAAPTNNSALPSWRGR